MTKLGLKDLPIEQKDEESLGIGDYVDVLSEFIRNCDTPITIALQGDWGSGKTSLMNLIENEIKSTEKDKKRILTIWFNTWQYSQFDLAGSLPLSMMQNITSMLEKESNHNSQIKEKIDQVSKLLLRIGNSALLGGASLIGLQDSMNAVQTKWKDQNQPESDIAMMLSKIKKHMKDIVESATKESNKDGLEKIVVFIDDLDRIKPVRAVELLEAMKVFLDIDKCVYVLACDYGVVTTGLQEKFNWEQGSHSGKDFFDKIIQVPFKMPLKRYEPESYLKKLLLNTELHFGDCDIASCIELIESSVGFNPRTIKRVLNMLQLLVMLNDKKIGVTKQNEPATDLQTEARHSNRVMFGILCMLEVYEPIYEYIIQDVPYRVKQLKSGLESLDEKDYEKLKSEIEKRNVSMQKAADFCDAFVKCIQLDQDESISKREVDHLIDLFSHTALVGHGFRVEDFDELAFSKRTKRALNQRYKKFFDCRRPDNQQFQRKRNYVFLHLHWFGDLYLSLKGDYESFQFGLESESNTVDIESLGEAIRSKLLWPTGGGFERVHDFNFYWFVTAPLNSQSSEQEFMEEVCGLLDSVTEPPSRLHDVFKEVIGTIQTSENNPR